MNRNPFHAVLTFIVGVIAAAAILVLLTLPADASASAYTCRWTVNHGTTPKTAAIRCTNGYARAYVWSDRYGRCIPTQTVPAAKR